MTFAVSAARMAAIDRAAQDEYGITERLLVENAARSLADCLRARYPARDTRFFLLCGRGNNGADGLALAAKLAYSGYLNVAVGLINGKLSAENEFRRGLLARAGIKAFSWPEDARLIEAGLASATVALDAVSGTGLSGPLRGEELALRDVFNKTKAFKIAIDLPSGFRDGQAGTDPLYAADLTLCLGLAKASLFVPRFRDQRGELMVLEKDIFPQALLRPASGDPQVLALRDIKASLPQLSPSAYKLSRGSVAVFAAQGAGWLASQAAARAGAGYVRLFAPAEAYPALAARLGAVVVLRQENSLELTETERDRVQKSSLTLVGPGWGLGEGRDSLLKSIMSAAQALVLDADALRLISRWGKLDLGGRPLLLTPHAGEAAALLGVDAEMVLLDAPRAAAEIARRYGATVILKGAITWIASVSGKTAVFDGAFPALGTAGSGDVLAGMSAATLAAELEKVGAAAGQETLEKLVFDCACRAVLLHAAVARRCFKKRGEFIADDLLPFVSQVVARSRAKLDR